MYGVTEVVNRHHLLAFRHGAVWFGKPERGISRMDVNQLNEQIEGGLQTYLFIVNLENTRIVHTAGLLQVSLKSPPEKDLVPPFYKQLKLLHRMKTWLKIAYPIDGFSANEYPAVMKTLAKYQALEKKHQKNSPAGVSMPGYFLMAQESPNIQNRLQ
jgi:hypothetical protein